MARSRRGSFGVAVLAAAFALALFSSTASATFPGANGLIAFTGFRDTPRPPRSDPLVDTIRPDGTDKKVLTLGWNPSWSPDGTHIVFLRSIAPQQNAIFTMRADGSDVRRLTFGRFSAFTASYSPSGRRILYTRFTSNLKQKVIATMRVDGTDRRVLARGVLQSDEYSPDGRRILYVDYGNDFCGALWNMRPNGSHKRQLVSAESGCNLGGHYSPDGKHIVFFHNNVSYVMRSDGSHLHPGGCSGIYSPDGHKMAWGGHVGPPRSAREDIFVGNLDCTASVRITHEPDGAAPSSWQPVP